MMNEGARDGSLLTVTSETNLERNVRRNSAGEVFMGFSVALSNNKLKTLPRYLSASVGSCHDFCKNGRNHTFESKGKYLVFPINSGRSGKPEKEQNRVKTVNLVERQKKRDIKQKAAPHVKTELYDRPKICGEETLCPVEKVIKCTETFETIECTCPSPHEKFESLEGFETIKQDFPVDMIVLCDDSEASIQKTTPLLEKTEAYEHFETANKKKPVKKIHSSLESTTVEQRNQSAKTLFPSVKPKVKQKVLSPIKTAISPEKLRVSKKEVSPSQRLDATVRPTPSRKPKITTLKSMSPENSTTGTSSRKNEKKGFKNMEPLKPQEKKSLKQPPASLSTQPPLNQVPRFTKSSSAMMHPRNVGKTRVDYDKIKKQTLHVIEPRSAANINSETSRLKASNYQ